MRGVKTYIACAWRRARGQLGLTAAAALVLMMSAAPASSAKQAAMVLDANTGKVLYSRNGDAKRYPASLTKMMTLYMVFERIDQRKLSYSSLISISAQAAAQPPSKLGLKPGEKIKLIDAMKALVTKSANDIAVAIAEHIGGSEARFARMMTERARQIGMRNTTFRNASGLPNSKQITTARDMVTLAIRLQDHFPGHYRIFRTRSMTYNGKTYRNHNRLLGRYRGTDGIKTGYIRASGFNLVSSVRRDNKHLIGVVFGSKSSRVRNARMRSLLDRNFKKASVRRTRKRSPRLLARPEPALRTVTSRREAEGKFRGTQALGRSAAKPPVRTVRTREIRSNATAATGHNSAGASMQQGSTTRGRAPSTLNQQALRLNGGAPAPRVHDGRVDSGAGGDGGYQIQVGAYLRRTEAHNQLDAVKQRSQGLLNGHRGIASEVKVGSKQYFRARFADFDSRKARDTCLELRRRSIDCLVIKAR